MVGLETKDDAGVFQISEDFALVQTIDFITPIVDDPYDYGQIAVSNALSDIYAMGAKPVTALNIVGFPIATLDKEILAQIIVGGANKAEEAGVAILGGHSVKDPEIKYGLTVTALANPKKIVRNNTAQSGNKLILTKSLGAGILTSALKNENLPQKLLKTITTSMKRLNKRASEIMLHYDVTACTDVSGFGLLGHLYEMMSNSRKTAIIYSDTLPLFPQALEFVKKENIPGGLRENLNFLEPYMKKPKNFDERRLNLLCDPQTSGGLLFTIPAERAEICIKQLHRAGEKKATIIGEIKDNSDFPLIIQ